jgi:hypothetical protein
MSNCTGVIFGQATKADGPAVYGAEVSLNCVQRENGGSGQLKVGMDDGLQLLVDGHNYKTAGVEVGMGVHAVSFHMPNIYEKLQVHSRAEAVAKALRHRIVY